MADKIVQLVDKNGDNIFPVATVANGATITMTDTDPGEGVALGDNEYVAVYGGEPITLDYSTSEIDTGTKWIDGSVIYKKTVNFGALPNNSTKSVAHNISGLTRIIEFNAIAYRNDMNVYVSLPFASTSGANMSISISPTNVDIATTADRTAFNECYVTLYYTKSA